MVEIPVMGKIAAGMPIEAIEDFQEIIAVSNPSIKDSRGYYALRVAGNSMMDEGIFDGDIVIIKNNQPQRMGRPLWLLLTITKRR